MKMKMINKRRKTKKEMKKSKNEREKAQVS
jgi:hypothetical protein